jgi:hypothetical protein
VKFLLLFFSGLMLSGCASLTAAPVLKKSDLKMVAEWQSAYGWQVIHQRITLAHEADEAAVRSMLEQSMDERIERLCGGRVHLSDRVFERLYVLDHAPEDKHHSHNLLARVMCQEAAEQPARVLIETLKNSTFVFQVIGTTYQLATPDVAALITQIKAQLAAPVNQVCPGLLSVQAVEYRHSQTTEELFDTVQWPVEKLKVVATVTCQ